MQSVRKFNEVYKMEIFRFRYAITTTYSVVYWLLKHLQRINVITINVLACLRASTKINTEIAFYFMKRRTFESEILPKISYFSTKSREFGTEIDQASTPKSDKIWNRRPRPKYKQWKWNWPLRCFFGIHSFAIFRSEKSEIFSTHSLWWRTITFLSLSPLMRLCFANILAILFISFSMKTDLSVYVCSVQLIWRCLCINL